MSRLFCDGMDAISKLSQKWDSVVNDVLDSLTPSGSGTWLRLGPYGRFGGQGVQFFTIPNASNGTTYFAKSIVNTVTAIVGFAFYIDVLPAGDTQILELYDAATLQCDLRLQSTGKINVTRGGTSLGISTNALTVGTWNYIEIKIKIDPSVGTVDLKFNGVSNLSLTAQNTRASANSFCNQVRFGQSGVSGATTPNYQLRYDDPIIMDTAGTTMNDFQGDLRIYTRYPVANGTYAQFSPNGAADNYVAVADAQPDEDFSFVADATVNDKDSYTFEKLPFASGTIKTSVCNIRARKDDAAAHTLGQLTRSVAVDSVNATQPALTSSYVDYQFDNDTDPNTGLAWTIAGLNAAEMGPKVIV